LFSEGTHECPTQGFHEGPQVNARRLGSNRVQTGRRKEAKKYQVEEIRAWLEQQRVKP